MLALLKNAAVFAAAQQGDEHRECVFEQVLGTAMKAGECGPRVLEASKAACGHKHGQADRGCNSPPP